MLMLRRGNKSGTCGTVLNTVELCGNDGGGELLGHPPEERPVVI